MNNETLGRILQFWFGTGDYSTEQYDHAIDLFFTEYPDGTARKKRRQPDGHNIPSKRKKATNAQSKPSSLIEITEATSNKQQQLIKSTLLIYQAQIAKITIKKILMFLN